METNIIFNKIFHKKNKLIYNKILNLIIYIKQAWIMEFKKNKFEIKI